MERLGVSIPFFLRFPTFASKHGLQKVFSQPSLQVQTSLSKIYILQMVARFLLFILQRMTSKFFSKVSQFLPHLFAKAGREMTLLNLMTLKKSINNSITQTQLSPQWPYSLTMLPFVLKKPKSKFKSLQFL